MFRTKNNQKGLSLKSRIQPKLKIFIILSVISSSIFLFFGCLQEYDSDKYMEIVQIENLRLSPTQGLNQDDHAEIHGYADQYVDWSFSTLPSQVINVWALDPFQYSLFISGIPASGYLLSTSSSDSGTFNVPEGNTWYIIFWNDEIGSQYTIVTYSANYVGDSRPPSITIYEPYGSYRAGQTLTIDWSSINAGSTVRIELYKGASLHTTIVSSTGNDGYHQWIIPLDTPPGSDYRVKVSSLSTSANDFSEYFEIRDPSIFIFYEPQSSSSYSMGSSYNLRYNNTEYVHEINLELYHNDVYELTIVTDENNYGAYRGDYRWWVPLTLIPSKNYKIKISDSDDPNTYGFSDNFEITEPRGFVFINPLTSSKVNPTTNFTIEWEFYGPCYTVRIDLYQDVYNGVYYVFTHILTISYNTPNDGSFIWLVPDVPTGNMYMIKIAATIDPGCYEYSEHFSIRSPESPTTIPSYNIFLLIALIIFTIYFYNHRKLLKSINFK